MFSHFCAFCVGDVAALNGPRQRAEELSSVLEYKKAVMGLTQQMCVVEALFRYDLWCRWP